VKWAKRGERIKELSPAFWAIWGLVMGSILFGIAAGIINNITG
jgi:hypothetical protein